MKPAKPKGLLILSAAACVLTACGQSEISTHYGVWESESEYSRPENQDSAEELAEATTTSVALTTTADFAAISTTTTTTEPAFHLSTTTTRATVSTTAATTAARTTYPTTAATTAITSATQAPVLKARAISASYSPGITYDVGDEFEVTYFNTIGSFSDCYITIKSKDGQIDSKPLSEFILLPTKEYIASANDNVLESLSPALYMQYADLFRRFAGGYPPLNFQATNDVQLVDGLYCVRLEPACTWDKLMRDVNQYFTMDYVITSGGQRTSDLHGYLREYNGYIWREDGLGALNVETYVKMNSIRSRSANEIVFDMAVTRDESLFGQGKNTVNETFIIRCENDMWKCAEIPLEWDMA